MNKNILSLSVFFLFFMLSGCGSNSKPDESSNLPKVAAAEMQKNKIAYNTSDFTFTLDLNITKKIDSTYSVELKNYDLNVKGCTIENIKYNPELLSLKGAQDSVETLFITGKFEQNCSVNGYIFRASQTVAKDGKSKTSEFRSEYNYSDDNPPPPENGYSLYNASTPLVIAQADKSYSVKVQLIKDGKVYPGGVVSMKPFSAEYGDVTAYSVTTGADGYAKFEYRSPSVLPVNGTSTSLELYFEDENNATITQNIILNFNTSGNGGTNPYTLVNVTTPINITTANEQKEISVYLVDNTTQVGVSGKKVMITTIENGYGSVSSATATTDASGKAVFYYTAPSDLTGLTSTQVKLRFTENSITTEKEVTLTILPPIITYFIQAEQNITVTSLAQHENIEVALYEQINNSQIVASDGKVVVAEFIMPVNGKIVQYESVVHNGYASFEYISPERKLPATDVNINFYLKDDQTVKDKTLLIFKTQVVDTVDKMFVSPNSITVSTPGQIFDIGIVTVNAGNIGISSEVQLEQPNNGTDYGSFDKTNLQTDDTGKAIVKYTAPDNISGLVERNITVTEKSQNITHTLNIKFNVTNQNTKYEIVPSVPGSFSVDTIDSFGIKIAEIGNPSNVIPDDNVTEVNLTSIFSNMLLFTNGTDKEHYEKVANNTNIGIKSLKLSGIAIIEVNATIYDGTKIVTISKSIPLTIISGPVKSMSMVYINSIPSCSKTPSLPGDRYLIHVVDKYSNPAQGVRVTPTLVNGVKIIGNRSGQINAATPPNDFNDSNHDFDVNVTTDDRLIVTVNSDRSNQSYLGNWTIDDVNGHNLDLNETYNGNTTDQLSYIVGNEKRVLGNDIVLAHIVDPANKYVTDESGGLEVEVCFDPPLAMHTVTLAAHILDRGQRTGISTKQGLRWDTFTSSVATVDNDGHTHTVSVHLGLGGAIVEDLSNLDVDLSSFIIVKKPHCKITTITNPLRTDGGGHVSLTVSTDGNVSQTGGVDTCSVSWNKKAGSIYMEY